MPVDSKPKQKYGNPADKILQRLDELERAMGSVKRYEVSNHLKRLRLSIDILADKLERTR